MARGGSRSGVDLRAPAGLAAWAGPARGEGGARHRGLSSDGAPGRLEARAPGPALASPLAVPANRHPLALFSQDDRDNVMLELDMNRTNLRVAVASALLVVACGAEKVCAHGGDQTDAVRTKVTAAPSCPSARAPKGEARGRTVWARREGMSTCCPYEDPCVVPDELPMAFTRADDCPPATGPLACVPGTSELTADRCNRRTCGEDRRWSQTMKACLSVNVGIVPPATHDGGGISIGAPVFRGDGG